MATSGRASRRTSNGIPGSPARPRWVAPWPAARWARSALGLGALAAAPAIGVGALFAAGTLGWYRWLYRRSPREGDRGARVAPRCRGVQHHGTVRLRQRAGAPVDVAASVAGLRRYQRPLTQPPRHSVDSQCLISKRAWSRRFSCSRKGTRKKRCRCTRPFFPALASNGSSGTARATRDLKAP